MPGTSHRIVVVIVINQMSYCEKAK